MKKIGIALGSGGARGLAHIIILQAFEELGIKPDIISGSSVGAMIGAAFCAGLSTKEIIENMDEMLHTEQAKDWDIYRNKDYLRLLEFVDIGLRKGGIIKGDKFIAHYKEVLGISTFEELKIPLKVVATNFYTREQSVFDHGELFAPIKASYSVPGLFPPMKINDNYYVDGGMVNPVPFDLLEHLVDITIAVDVLAQGTKPLNDENPPLFETFFSSFQIMQSSIFNARLRSSKPTILIKTDMKNIRMLEFVKSQRIFKLAHKYKDQLKNKLEKELK
jgi:NTE family protein